MCFEIICCGEGKRFRQSMHRGRPTGESFDHGPAGWIRQSGECGIELIHNHMVVNYRSMSRVDFGVPDFDSTRPVTRLIRL